MESDKKRSNEINNLIFSKEYIKEKFNDEDLKTNYKIIFYVKFFLKKSFFFQ